MQKIITRVLTVSAVLVVLCGSLASQGLVITAPAGAERWALGSDHAITWNPGGVSGNVRLVLMQNGRAVAVIAENVPASSGSYKWKTGGVLSGTVQAGTGYAIRLQTMQGNVLADSGGSFELRPASALALAARGLLRPAKPAQQTGTAPAQPSATAPASASSAAAPTTPQAGPAKLAGPGGRLAARPRHVQIQLARDTVAVNRLAPITQFRAFRFEDFRDPKTNAPIRADQTITLRNGRSITGKDYVDQLNTLEGQLNAYGYSMHDRRTQPLELQRSRFDVSRLSLQRTQLAELRQVAWRVPLAPAFASRIQRHDFPALRADFASRVLQAGQQAPTKLPEDFNPLDYPYHWEKDMGDSQYFRASISADMDLSIQKELAKASADAAATVSVFGHQEDLLKMSAGAQAPPKGSTEPMKVHFYVKALGEDLFTPIDEESKDPIKKEDDLKEDYPVDYEIPFTIGPIPCSIKFGFTATIGVKYGLYLTPLYVDAKVTPYVHTDAWAKCGVDLYIVSAGVRFDLTLVNEDLEFGGELGLATDKPDPYVHILLYGKQNLTALAGKFKAFVSVDLFFWSDEWDWTIFDWDGFRYSDFMFQYGRDIDLRTGQVSDINVTKGIRVKIRHIAVDHNALKNWVKDKGYFAYAFIVPSGTQINRDNDRDITDYYKNTRWDGQGQENLYPFPTWILGKKVLTAPGKAVISVYVCYATNKTSNLQKWQMGPDGKCGGGMLRLTPGGASTIVLTYDFAAKTISDRQGRVLGKAGEFVTLNGPDGQVELAVQEY